MRWYSRSRSDFLELLVSKYYPMDEYENWCLWLWDKPTDYKLTEWLLDALPTLYPQDEIIYEYNQYNQKRSQKSCTLFSPIWAISDLFNVEIPLETIKVWDNDSYSKGRMKNEWWYVALGVEHIAGEWNDSDFAKKYWKVAYYSIDLKNNELLKRILEKRYTVCIWFQGNSNYTNDKNKDWILNWTSFWSYTYGHAVSAIWSTKYPQRIKDNYKGIKYNIYEVEHEFSEIPCFYDRWYVFTKVAEDALEEVKRLNKMKTLTENMIADNSEMWHLTNDIDYKAKLHAMNNVHRKKLQDIETELKKYV